ncbi:MAG: RecX family transcriptional regulator [Lachnospiraceae bacterium]|nr:RecX family transcriptional regulator [Lachnospiraceae bacterium]
MQILGIEYLDKGKYIVSFDCEEEILLYRSEIKELDLEEGSFINSEKYNDILNIVSKRATKRAMHILEKRDKTEKQLRDKLKEGKYPDSAIDKAIDYVKSFRYLDDSRYAYNYISYRIESKSRANIIGALVVKGINKDLASEIYDELYDPSYTSDQIEKHLVKKKYFEADERQKQNRIIQSIMRKGFSYNDISKIISKHENF